MQIEPQDGLPPVACMKCTQEVNRVVHFVEICQVSNKILTHLFQKYYVSFDSVVISLFRVANCVPFNCEDRNISHLALVGIWASSILQYSKQNTIV
jgi:hypothetical protein